MAHERFLDREQQPDQDLVNRAIGREVLPVWEAVTAYLQDKFPEFKPEMIFYNPQHGWAVRYRLDAQQLCMLFPERGSFSALIILDPEEEAITMEMISYFNARIRAQLNQASTLPQGRWLWIRLEDHTDFVGFKLLMDVKIFS